MLTEARREAILNELTQRDLLTVDDVAKRFGCSLSTARRDLDVLATAGLIRRLRGGAVAARNGVVHLEDTSAESPDDPAAEAKWRIAQAAAGLVVDNDTVGIGGGTTNRAVLRALSGRRITIVTNSLDQALAALTHPDLRVVMVGGEVLVHAHETVGPQLAAAMRNLNIDIMFMSVSGLTVEQGLGLMTHLEAEGLAVVASRARRIVVVADQSKLGRTAMAQALPIDRVDTVITDAPASHPELRAMAERGITIITA